MHIVVIDDEKVLSKIITLKLQEAWYRATSFRSYAAYKKSNIIEEKIDLYLIDVELWDGSGIDIAKEIKSHPSSHTQSTPILFISGHNTTSLKVEWLDCGGDDYIIKPFDFDELMARIRRSIRKTHFGAISKVVEYNSITFDIQNREVRVKGKEVNLSKKEIQILEYFLSHRGKCVKKTLIQETFWKDCSETSIPENTINVTICNLRKKLGKWFKLKTIVGEWYCLQK